MKNIKDNDLGEIIRITIDIWLRKIWPDEGLNAIISLMGDNEIVVSSDSTVKHGVLHGVRKWNAKLKNKKSIKSLVDGSLGKRINSEKSCVCADWKHYLWEDGTVRCSHCEEANKTVGIIANANEHSFS